MNTHPRVYFADRAVALDELRERGARAAHALADSGIGRGDVIAVLMRNEPAFVEALACIRGLDAVLILVPWHLTAAEIGPILEAVRPALLIVHADLVARAREAAVNLPGMRMAMAATPAAVRAAYQLPARSECPPSCGLSRWEDLVENAVGSLPIGARTIQAIAVTSGSIGAPKIIRRDGEQRWIQWAAHCTRAWPAIRRSIVTAPLCHTGQYGVFSQACHLDADQVILPKFDPEAFLQAVERYRINHAYLSPPMFVQLLKLPAHIRARYDVSSLDYVLQTGAPCAPQVKRQMIDWLGPVIWEVYGSSETSTIAACSSQEWLAKPNTVGRPLRRILIFDDQGHLCPPGKRGQIYVDVSEMPHITYQYGEVLRRRVDGAEFISVGDAGSIDEDGYLSISGRVDEVINNGGIKVYPEEVENAILRHPGVQDCVVFGIPDAVNGQAVAALVRMTGPSPDTERELRTFLKDRISEHKIPVIIRRAQSPLRGETGKLNRAALAAAFNSMADSATAGTGQRATG